MKGGKDSSREHIKAEVEALVGRLAGELKMDREAVSDIALLYLQARYRNPTTAQKNAAYLHWEGICQDPNCKKKVARKDAVFHHRERRIPGQHMPENLRPYHPEHHDSEHGVRHGSLSKGSPRSRKSKDSKPPD